MIEHCEIGMHDSNDCDHAGHEAIFGELVRFGADPRCRELDAALVIAICNGEITMDTARALVRTGGAV